MRGSISCSSMEVKVVVVVHFVWWFLLVSYLVVLIYKLDRSTDVIVRISRMEGYLFSGSTGL